jgi:ketosteroid isomerase-like protein
MNKTLWRVALLAGLLGGALMACARTPAVAESPRAALEATIQRWVAAVNARDAAALSSMMTDDVELEDETATVSGRDAVIRALRADGERGKLIVTTRELSLSNDEAWHTAALARTRDGVLQASGDARENWKRVNGEWKLDRRAVTGGVDPDVSVTRPSTKEPVLDRPKE